MKAIDIRFRVSLGISNAFECFFSAKVVKGIAADRRWLGAALLTFLLVGVARGTDAPAPGGGGVKFVAAPQGSKVVTFRLAVPERTAPRQPGYLERRSSEAEEEATSVPAAIAETYAGKEFSAFEIAALPNGTRYLALLNEDKSLKFLTRSDFPLYYARLYKVTVDSKPELLREGFQSQGHDVTVPVELGLPGIGATGVKSLRTEVGYSFQGIQNGKPQVYIGRGGGLQVVGSEVTPEGRMTMTVVVPEAMTVTPETQVTLRFEPFKPGLPERTASGKVTDFLTLGAARFALTELAADFSSASVAVVAGSLEETLRLQLQLGAQMPPFAQVELVTRKTCTREELLERAKSAAGIVFIFGDLVPPGGRFGPPYVPTHPGGGSSALPLPAAEVAEQLGLERKSKPVIVFVTRQISIEFLYQELRNRTPDYIVLTDYADPLRTTFRLPAGPGYYGSAYSPAQEASLRQLFNLPDQLAIAAFDRNGKVVYVKANVGRDFLPSLAEARATLAE